MILGKRYQDDSEPTLVLTETQLKNKLAFESRVRAGEYPTEQVPCVLCGSGNFEPLSEKDRYGFHAVVVICRGCGLVQTNPRMTQDSYAKFYADEYRGIYDPTPGKTDLFFESQKKHAKEIHDSILKHSSIELTNRMIVEIGAGAGGVLKYFADLGHPTFGVDLDPACVKFANENGVEVQVGTLDRVIQHQKRPGLVIYCHVFEHLLDPVAELIRLRGILAEDGIVYIEVPGIRFIPSSYGMDFLGYLQNAHTCHFTLRTLSHCAKKAGFDLIYGDEKICAILAPSKPAAAMVPPPGPPAASPAPDAALENDYDATLRFLLELERRRNSPLHLLPRQLFSRLRRLKAGLISALRPRPPPARN